MECEGGWSGGGWEEAGKTEAMALDWAGERDARAGGQTNQHRGTAKRHPRLFCRWLAEPISRRPALLATTSSQHVRPSNVARLNHAPNRRSKPQSCRVVDLGGGQGDV